MKYIVIDFEFTDVPRQRKNIRYMLKHEIIEIGAVKLDKNCNRIDTFSLFVKPECSTLTHHCAEITGISYNELKNAPSFEEAFELFEEWIGDDDFKIYTWSNNDKIQLKKECHIKNLEKKFSRILNRHWTDLQKLFIRFSGIKQCMNLEKALNSLDIKIEGKLHRAVDDAINTSAIFSVMKDKKESAKRFGAIHDFFKINEEEQHSTLGDIFGDLLSLAMA